VLGALHYERGDDRLGLRALLHAGHRRLDLVENFTGFLLDPVEGDRRDQTQRSLTFGADVALRASIAETLSLQAGAGVRGDALDQGQDHVDAAGAALDPERRLEGSQALFHARAGLTFSPAPIVRVAAGARLDVARVDVSDALGADARGGGTLSAVSPRASVNVEPWPGLGLFAAYGRGFRPPEARAFSSFDPALTGITEDLYDGGEPRMTSTDSFELGARWSTPGGSFGAAASGFATFIERESIYDHVSGVSLELNATRRLGGELELSSRPVSGLTVSADATFADARFVESGNAVPLAPWLIGNLRVIGGGDLGLRGGLRLLAIAPRDLPHGARGSTLLSLAGTLGYHWARFRLDAEIENMLARRLREGEYHYASAWQQGESASQLPVLHSVAGPPLNVRLALTALF
jgi:outer membrane receptor protein involved in Fe transport